MLDSIDRFTDDAQSLSQESFVQRYSEPVLVIGAFELDEQTSTWTRQIDLETHGTAHLGMSVAPIAKREGSSRFRSMIVIGRSSTSDLRIRAAEVSKVHAYLQRKEGAVTITDAGSTNGTFVNDVRLKANVEAVTLTPGDQVKLGVVPLTFHDAPSFYAFLRNLVLE